MQVVSERGVEKPSISSIVSVENIVTGFHRSSTLDAKGHIRIRLRGILYPIISRKLRKLG